MTEAFKVWLTDRYQEEHQLLDKGRPGDFEASIVNLLDDADVKKIVLGLVKEDKNSPYGSIIHPKLKQALLLGLEESMGCIASHSADKFMMPPQSIIDLLTHSVRAYGGRER